MDSDYVFPDLSTPDKRANYVKLASEKMIRFAPY